MIKNFLSDDQPKSEPYEPTSPSGSTLGLFGSISDDRPTASHSTQDPVSTGPESAADTFRRTGMAYSAGIAFSATVIFMLILGWGADVLLGTSPWGIVGGIVLGSLIGFIQFVRITSQIFKK